MLPRVLSAVGLLLIALALLGFALPLSTAPAGTASEVSLLSGGESPADTNSVPNTNSAGNTSTNVNGKPPPSNLNTNVRPTPAATPAPTPTPAPTATPPPVPSLEDVALRKAVEANLAKAEIRGVSVEAAGGVVTLKGEVPAAKLQDAVRAASEAGARRVVNRLRRVGAVSPAEGILKKRPGDAVVPARPAEKPPPELLLEIQAAAPEQSRIEVEWPARLGISDTGTIRVSLVSEPAPSSTPATDIPGNSLREFPLPAGCVPPGASLRNAYGPQFAARASARLTTAAADFDVQPADDEEQPLDASRATWAWLIKPKSGGSHNVTVGVAVRWRHRQREQEKPACRVLHRTLPVLVQDKWYNEGNLKTAQTVIGLVGLVLQLPVFFWMRRKEKGEEKEEKKE